MGILTEELRYLIFTEHSPIPQKLVWNSEGHIKNIFMAYYMWLY